MNPYTTGISLLAIFLGGVAYCDHQSKTEVNAYVRDCQSKQGQVVQMYLHNKHTWIQCVRGLEIVPLPQDM